MELPSQIRNGKSDHVTTTPSVRLDAFVRHNTRDGIPRLDFLLCVSFRPFFFPDATDLNQSFLGSQSTSLFSLFPFSFLPTDMPRPSLAGLTRTAGYGARASRVVCPSRLLTRRAAIAPISAPKTCPTSSVPAVLPGTRSISSSSRLRKGLIPETDNPKPTKPAESTVTIAAADITEGEYHQLADEYLETLLSKLEETQEQREGLDVEFSVSSASGTPAPAVQRLLPKRITN